jgi:hypothetical protein
MSTTTITATRTGTLPGGLDCYICDDGGRYLSQRGIIRGIRVGKKPGKSTGGEDGNWAPYLARLPNASAELTSGVEVEIRIPIDGGGFRLAKGRPARFLIAFCSHYVQEHAAGNLHHTQVPIALGCANLLAAFAEKGIEAMIDEACGAVVRAPTSAAAHSTQVPTMDIAIAVDLCMKAAQNAVADLLCGPSATRLLSQHAERAVEDALERKLFVPATPARPAAPADPLAWTRDQRRAVAQERLAEIEPRTAYGREVKAAASADAFLREHNPEAYHVLLFLALHCDEEGIASVRYSDGPRMIVLTERRTKNVCDLALGALGWVSELPRKNHVAPRRLRVTIPEAAPRPRKGKANR